MAYLSRTRQVKQQHAVFLYHLHPEPAAEKIHTVSLLTPLAAREKANARRLRLHSRLTPRWLDEDKKLCLDSVRVRFRLPLPGDGAQLQLGLDPSPFRPPKALLSVSAPLMPPLPHCTQTPHSS